MFKEDHSIIARLLASKCIRWEPFSFGDVTNGEICFDGMRYTSNLDDCGVPEIYDCTAHSLALHMKNCQMCKAYSGTK